MLGPSISHVQNDMRVQYAEFKNAREKIDSLLEVEMWKVTL